MKRVGDTNRHHLVSQGYLRAWRPKGEKKRVRVRLLPATVARLIGTADICVKTHWHSTIGPDGSRDRTIETNISHLEDVAIPMVRTFAVSGFTSDEDRVVLAFFLSTLSMRGTTLRQDLRDRGVEVGEEYLREHPDAGPAVRYEQERHRSGTRALETLFTEVAPLAASMLASMHWRVYRDPAAGIATSDHPVVFLNAEAQLTTESPLANENIDAAFVALTPTTLLVGSWLRGPDHVIQDAPSGLVAWFNQAVLAQADAHFIEPPTFALLPTETPPLPDIDLTHDSERIAAAKGALRITANAPDAAQLAMAIWADGTYRLRATFQTPAQPGGQN